MAKPSVNKVQDCIDSAGRLAAFIDELWGDCNMLDVLTICSEANVILGARYYDRTSGTPAVARIDTMGSTAGARPAGATIRN
jgi:hypothetical protein